MLNGVDPILIFQIFKLVTPASAASQSARQTQMALTSSVKQKVTEAIIPIYLSRELTGLSIDTESKNIDIQTTQDSLASGEAPLVNQKAIGSVSTVNMVAKKGSIGLTILLALSDRILEKVTSQEYIVTYMNGAVTIFGGLIHGLSIDQNANEDLVHVKLDISRGNPKSNSVEVNEDPDAVRLGTAGTIPPAGASTVTPPPSGGTSVIQPGLR